MSLDLKRQLIAQLVESSRLLRNYIDNRAKGVACYDPGHTLVEKLQTI